MKYCADLTAADVFLSPSMRREWIEMAKLEEKSQADFVSLHAEGVD